MDPSRFKPYVRARLERLPSEIWDCERCESEDSMAIRRSSLNEQFYADDVMLKCMECWYTATHGVPFEDEESFEEEWDHRPKRVVDFAQDAESGNPVADRLENLGYVARSDSI